MDTATKENYTTDIPISEVNQDCFQRFNFSKRIAETISQQKTADSIVIGVYGDWGEGKTSVMNFIERNLSTFPDIIVCKFNPWRFKDESQLLSAFFNLLSAQLKKSIHTKKEKIGRLFAEYAEGVIPSIYGIKPGGLIKLFSKKYSTVDVEEQKRRIEKFLEEEKKRVVIFVDDIDRLDKKEIQTIFKLIKLTGDFSFTSYVLAFDEKMVAKAIGENYEDGGEQAGKNFLEKIIQVPLRLPKAQTTALKKFCFKQVDNAVGPRNGHNKVWKAKAKEFGCTGERCSNDVSISPSFKGTCPKCKRKIFRHRRKNISCGVCDSGHFNLEFVFRWEKI